MAHYDFNMPVTEAQIRQIKVNDTVTLNGTLFGIRDATLIHMFDRGRKTRFDLNGQAVIHTGAKRAVGRRNRRRAGRLRADLHRHHDQRANGALHAPLMSEYGVRIIIGKGGLSEASLRRSGISAASIWAIVGGARRWNHLDRADRGRRSRRPQSESL